MQGGPQRSAQREHCQNQEERWQASPGDEGCSQQRTAGVPEPLPGTIFAEVASGQGRPDHPGYGGRGSGGEACCCGSLGQTRDGEQQRGSGEGTEQRGRRKYQQPAHDYRLHPDLVAQRAEDRFQDDLGDVVVARMRPKAAKVMPRLSV